MSVNSAKLPPPLGVVKEGSMVKAVVVGTVRFGMNRRRYHRHFVSVNGVTAIKMLNLDKFKFIQHF